LEKHVGVCSEKWGEFCRITKHQEKQLNASHEAIKDKREPIEQSRKSHPRQREAIKHVSSSH